jgi:pyruvate dehydrogenase E1 component
VILAKTKKGYGMGTAAQGRMTTHQQKKLDTDQLHRLPRPLRAAAHRRAVRRVRVRAPARESPEMAYLHARREKLGGYLPARDRTREPLATPEAPRSRSSRSKPTARTCPRPSPSCAWWARC